MLFDRKFNVSSIMPICLPPSRNFKDDDRGREDKDKRILCCTNENSEFKDPS